MCHPLREDVSWNLSWFTLRRDSSWSSSSWGCELKLLHPVWVLKYILSSSSWGCELKYLLHKPNREGAGHPLREDVSWNSACKLLLFSISVILFVRMWVEIVTLRTCCMNSSVILFVRMWVEIFEFKGHHPWERSSSSWGCELKYWTRHVFSWFGVVILFVRMWVEIFSESLVISGFPSSSSWGCELKYAKHWQRGWWYCHPLREDVSWNIN